MPDESIDWDGLLEDRLTQSDQRKRDEAQASEPPPGPEATRELLERLLDAAETGELRTSETPTGDGPVTPGTPEPPRPLPIPNRSDTQVTLMQHPMPRRQSITSELSAALESIPNVSEGGAPAPDTVQTPQPPSESHPERPYIPAPPMLNARVPRPQARPNPPSERLRPISYVPSSHGWSGKRRGRRRLNFDRLKRIGFWFLLLAILIAGILLTIKPSLLLEMNWGKEEEEALTPQINWEDAGPEETPGTAPGPGSEVGNSTATHPRQPETGTDAAQPHRDEVQRPQEDLPREIKPEAPPPPDPQPPADVRRAPDPATRPGTRATVPDAARAAPRVTGPKTGRPAVKPGIRGAPDPSGISPPQPPLGPAPPGGPSLEKTTSG